MVAPMPLVGQVSTEAEGVPSEITEQPTTEAILLPTSKRMELPLTLVAPTAAGTTPPVDVLLT